MNDSKPNKYNHSKLYKLLCEDGYYYIGCTTNSLSKRLGGHKYSSKKNSQQKIYRHILNIGWDNVKIVLIDEYCFNNREQLLRSENELITKCKGDPLCLNNKLSYTGLNEQEYKKEYREKNKDKIKEHRDINKDKQKEYMKEYYIQNKDILIQKRQIYNDINRNKILESKKKYYENNKDRLNEKKICECGISYTEMHKLRHQKSKKHIEYINNQITNDNS